MKKVIFGIFAHPDDEAFGPAGTLIMEKSAGSEVHLICATAGENGMNPDTVDDLAALRLQEWRTAGDLIGADSMHHLGYEDGGLSNNAYLEIADAIKRIIVPTIADREDIEVEFMSLDLGGLSGHLDHIAISRIVCYVFFTLKPKDHRLSRLRLACLSRDTVPTSNCNWLYMDAGRAKNEIDETVDAREHIEQILAVMNAHSSQRDDRDAHLKKNGDSVAINHFRILS